MWIISTFFRLVYTLCNLVRSASSFFDVNVKKLKDPGDKFGPYTILEDLYWLLMQRSRVLFQMWIIWKIGAVIFLFVQTFYTVDNS